MCWKRVQIKGSRSGCSERSRKNRVRSRRYASRYTSETEKIPNRIVIIGVNKIKGTWWRMDSSWTLTTSQYKNYKPSNEGSKSQVQNKWERFFIQQPADPQSPHQTILHIFIYVDSKRVWGSIWNMNLLRVTKQTRHKMLRKNPELKKVRAWERFRGSTTYACPILKLPMRSIYDHCWKKGCYNRRTLHLSPHGYSYNQ